MAGRCPAAAPSVRSRCCRPVAGRPGRHRPRRLRLSLGAPRWPAGRGFGPSMSTLERKSTWASPLWLIGLVLVFGVFVYIVLATPVPSFDVQLEQAVQTFHPAWLDTLTSAISFLGFPPGSIVIDAV